MSLDWLISCSKYKCSLDCFRTDGVDRSTTSAPDVSLRMMASAHFPHCVMDGALLDRDKTPLAKGSGVATRAA